MPRADYDGWMASAYDAGRRLAPGAFEAWGAAARPFLGLRGDGPVLDLGAGTGRFSVGVRSTTVSQVTAASIRELHRRIATRADSTLAALDDDTFAAGLEALACEVRAEASPTPVVDRLDFVVLRLPIAQDPSDT